MANIPRPRVDAIDVAHYQVVIDEHLIPHLPVMTCKGSEGANYKDPTRPNWIRIFRDRAEVIGMYHWVRSDSSMESQVQNLAACYREEGVLPRDGDLAPGWIVQLDWERTYNNVNGSRVLVRDLTVAEIELWHHFADIAFGPGRVVTYGSDWVPNFITWRARNPDKPVWYANYSLSDLPAGGQQESAKYNACLWQWSSQVMVPGLDTASRPGIDVSEIQNLQQILTAAHLTVDPPTPTPVEDTMNYYVVTGANARFIGLPPNVQWTGPGDAKVDAAIATQLAAGNLTQVNLTGGPNAFAATFLSGPLPTGDALHTWTGDEFAALLPHDVTVGTIDTTARAQIVALNDSVGRLGQRQATAGAELVQAGNVLQGS